MRYGKNVYDFLCVRLSVKDICGINLNNGCYCHIYMSLFHDYVSISYKKDLVVKIIIFFQIMCAQFGIQKGFFEAQKKVFLQGPFYEKWTTTKKDL